MRLLGFVAWVVVIGVLSQLAAAELPERWEDDGWEEAARKVSLTKDDMRQLGREKLLVAGGELRQSFDAYIGSPVPVFITSDSLLNAYHVLFEESVLRAERARAAKLAGMLRLIQANLEKAQIEVRPATALPAARLRARVIIGTALKLLDDSAAVPDKAAAALAEEEVRRIRAATAMIKPAWLGPPDPGFLAIDYTRFKPRGFYTRSLALQRYFQAVAWLQSIPLRVGRDEELLTALLLGECFDAAVLDWDRQKRDDLVQFFDGYVKFAGAGDDLGVEEAPRAGNPFSGGGDLERIRRAIVDRARGMDAWPRIGDQVRAPDDLRRMGELSFRVMPAARLPDAALFARTADPRHRPFPNGLEVAALLGSEHALTLLPNAGGADALRKAIDEARPLLKEPSLYGAYLRCLSALLDEPEKDVPPLFRSAAWRTKSVQTVLAGWAQARHTWVLQAKENVMVFSFLHEAPPGFVEPEPQFFARMADLVEQAAELLEMTGAFSLQGAVDPSAVAALARRMADRLAEHNGENRGKEDFDDEEMEAENSARIMLAAAGMAVPAKGAGVGRHTARIAAMRQLADDVEHGSRPLSEALAHATDYEAVELRPRWRDLARLCRRLESIAHKQLRGVEFDSADVQVLRGYGETLARLMFYDGNSYEHPRDDAPRAVDVFHNPQAGRHLIVGIGRPRSLYVLYPHGGREVLCRGVVLPYHEFSSEQRLTDREWINLLDSPRRPPQPEWLQPIHGSRGTAATRPAP